LEFILVTGDKDNRFHFGYYTIAQYLLE
jgi:hypothetical protein